MVDDETLRLFRLRVQQQQRMRWHVVEYDESVPKALLYQRVRRNRHLIGRGLFPTRPSTTDRWRKMFVDDEGEVRHERADPPSQSRLE